MTVSLPVTMNVFTGELVMLVVRFNFSVEAGVVGLRVVEVVGGLVGLDPGFMVKSA